METSVPAGERDIGDSEAALAAPASLRSSGALRRRGRYRCNLKKKNYYDMEDSVSLDDEKFSENHRRRDEQTVFQPVTRRDVSAEAWTLTPITWTAELKNSGN